VTSETGFFDVDLDEAWALVLPVVIVETAVRRTWLPAVAIAVALAGAGFVVQHELPGARSLGDVVRALRA